MGRGRPRTRRIIARVILPRCAPALLSPPYLSALPPSPRALCLALMRTYVRTYTRVSICMREKSERKKIPVARGGRGGRERGRGIRGAGGQGRGVEALEEEVRGQPHSRRGRRDAHRATPTRKAFSTKPSSSSPSSFFSSSCPSFLLPGLLLLPPSRFSRFFPLASTKRADRARTHGASSLNRTVRYTYTDTEFLAYQQEYFGTFCHRIK